MAISIKYFYDYVTKAKIRITGSRKTKHFKTGYREYDQ